MFLATSDLIGAGELAVAGVGLVLAFPAYRIARAAVSADHTKRLAIAVAQYLGIPNPEDTRHAPPPPTTDRPSVRDLLSDLIGESAAATAEIKIVREMLEWHLADGHGGEIPEYLLRHPTPPRRRK